MWFIYYFNFERNYDVLKSKSLCFLLFKNINFNKNETESKIEILAHSSREMNHVLQLVLELKIKRKTVISWSSRKEKDCVFCNVYFVRRNFFLIFMCNIFSLYRINFQNIYTFAYHKTLLRHQKGA